MNNSDMPDLVDGRKSVSLKTKILKSIITVSSFNDQSKSKRQFIYRIEFVYIKTQFTTAPTHKTTLKVGCPVHTIYPATKGILTFLCDRWQNAFGNTLYTPGF